MDLARRSLRLSPVRDYALLAGLILIPFDWRHLLQRGARTREANDIRQSDGPPGSFCSELDLVIDIGAKLQVGCATSLCWR